MTKLAVRKWKKLTVPMNYAYFNKSRYQISAKTKNFPKTGIYS